MVYRDVKKNEFAYSKRTRTPEENIYRHGRKNMEILIFALVREITYIRLCVGGFFFLLFVIHTRTWNRVRNNRAIFIHTRRSAMRQGCGFCWKIFRPCVFVANLSSLFRLELETLLNERSESNVFEYFRIFEKFRTVLRAGYDFTMRAARIKAAAICGSRNWQLDSCWMWWTTFAFHRLDY